MAMDCLALVIVWSAREPERVGEVALFRPEVPRWVLGRYPPLLGPNGRALPFFRQRPAGLEDAAAANVQPELAGETLSRQQLVIAPTERGLAVENIGGCQLEVNGNVVTDTLVRPGDTIYLRNQLLLYCTRRPLSIPALRAYPLARAGAFGEPDQDGMVGESPIMWALRDRLAAAARSNFHVLIVGDSGSGKELAAQTIHRLSTRAHKPLIADNIAAIPPSLAAALLFGNKKNFPNPGMEERVGLIGAANGGTLFLDEIGDMPEPVQPMFLRVTERQGEYYRLGEENKPQRSSFRLVGATNRPELLRHELKRRFQREVFVPGIENRKEDIPLFIRYLLRALARQDDFDAPRFLRDGQPRIHPQLVEQLLHHSYKTHVSEISFLLGQAIMESDGDMIRPLRKSLSPRAQIGAGDAAAMALARNMPRPLPTPERAQVALLENGGDITRAAAALNISRDQLNRMIRREGLQVQRPLRRTGTLLG